MPQPLLLPAILEHEIATIRDEWGHEWVERYMVLRYGSHIAALPPNLRPKAVEAVPERYRAGTIKWLRERRKRFPG